MYKVENNVRVHLFDVHKNAFTSVFDSEEDLINFLAKTYSKSWLNGLTNPYIDSVNMNGNDTENNYNWFGEQTAYVRRYIFIDDNDRIIDVRKYKDEAIKRFEAKCERTAKEREEFWTSLQHGDVLINKYDKIPYRYRMDPVPNLIRRRVGCHWLRHMKTTQELRMYGDEEHRKYARARRKNIPTVYDDIPRGTQRCWKEQSKKRKQWM